MSHTSDSLRIVHASRYSFEQPVPGGAVIDTHLEPQSHSFHQLVVKPRPAQRVRARDVWGNHESRLVFPGELRRLEVTAVSTVERDPACMLDESILRQGFAALIEKSSQAEDLAAYRGSTKRVPSELAADYARKNLPIDRPVQEGVEALVAAIHADFRYDTRATRTETPLVELIERRRGVCQDFSHFALACLRSRGLAARYVSGYLAESLGSNERGSHAWVALWLDGDVWLELDPTLGRVGRLGHITLGWGRDYDDVAPVCGELVGRGRCRLSTRVTVEAVDGRRSRSAGAHGMHVASASPSSAQKR